ncbi:MAG: A24 family peptidase [Frisingicoccus sp.]|uniref:prepilin peptidase n=1 Tax=Frisingicoccus sp. TaxID=1918627 RepID=UPI002A802BCE|nr:A24 family peptidase [Frisingicoccus sp.]MDD6232446.1 A24 family peptidase [Frisingicoccus sp.]MDY4835057.1 A24 family peptidase [Frisingicoccus sp.]
MGCLFCLSLVDLESYIIPDSCLIIAATAWVAAIPFEYEKYGTLMGIGTHVLSAFVYGGGVLAISLLMDIVLKKESLGGGDIKLIAVMGLYLGMDASLFAMLISCILGLIFVLIRKGIHPNAEDHFPFGPAIAVSIWIILMYGDLLIK